MKVRNQSGYTLASLAVALLVIAILYINIKNDTDVRMKALDFDTVILSADLLGKAVNSYYNANCSDGAGMVTPSINDLVVDGYIRNANVLNNNLNINFTPQIIDPGTSDSMIFVVANASDANIAQQIVDTALNASRVGSTVTFSYKPSRNITSNEARVSELRTYFGEDYCI